MSAFVGKVLFPLLEFVQGRNFRSAFEGFLSSQFLSPDELKRRQEEKLRAIVGHAFAHVPFYRESFVARDVGPEDIRRIDDLARLPIVSREDIRRNFPAKMTAGNISSRRRRLDRTSGSTGIPLEFFQDRDGRDLRLASFLLFDSWAGIRPGDRSVHIGAPQPFSLRSAMFDRLRGRRSISVFDLDSRTIALVLKGLKRLKPALIEGYASAIHLLALAVIQHGQGPRPRAVVATSDMLPSREVVERAFACPVFNRYGNREMGGALAQNCPEGQGLHINSEICVVEVVDEAGRPAAPGQVGRVLLTDLTNQVMPFIRYDSGDMAAAGGSCSCGRGFPLLSRVEGRSSECLVLPGGRLLSPVAFSHYLFVSHGYTEHILKYQAEQTGPKNLCFRFVPVGEASESLMRGVRADLARLLGPGLTIDVEAVEDIPAEPGGKQAVLKPYRSPRAGQA
jgi:phenylacetate-CoA ligase